MHVPDEDGDPPEEAEPERELKGWFGNDLAKQARVMATTVGPGKKTAWSGVMVAPHAALKPGGVLRGWQGRSFTLAEPIGSGGSGTVWKAHAEDIAEAVAVKVVRFDQGHEQARPRFAREAAMSAHLEGPHLVRIIDYGLESTYGFMVMELLEGEDLQQRLKRLGRLTVADAETIIDGVGRALSRAHREGVVHRDVKPGNIFFAQSAEGETVKVLDFGIAKILDDDAQLTRMDARIGSALYMSPEQIMDPKSVDDRSDAFSLAAVLYRSLTGRLPHTGDGGAVFRAILYELPSPPSVVVPDLCIGFDSFFAKALAKDPGERFESTEAMVAAFHAAAEDNRAGHATLARMAPPVLETPPAALPEPAMAPAVLETPPAVLPEPPMAPAVLETPPAVLPETPAVMQTDRAVASKKSAAAVIAERTRNSRLPPAADVEPEAAIPPPFERVDDSIGPTKPIAVATRRAARKGLLVWGLAVLIVVVAAVFAILRARGRI